MEADDSKRPDLIELMLGMAQDMMDEKGIHPEPGLSLAEDGGITLAALAFMGDGSDARQAFWSAFTEAVAKPGCVEVVFTSDRYALPDQQVPTTDWLAVFQWRTESVDAPGKLRYGVLPYDIGSRTLFAIDWNHPFWLPHLKAERARYCPFLIRTSKADGWAVREDS